MGDSGEEGPSGYIKGGCHDCCWEWWVGRVVEASTCVSSGGVKSFSSPVVLTLVDGVVNARKQALWFTGALGWPG
eukprot:761559-Hanusia_phi.AAC.2